MTIAERTLTDKYGNSFTVELTQIAADRFEVTATDNTGYVEHARQFETLEAARANYAVLINDPMCV